MKIGLFGTPGEQLYEAVQRGLRRNLHEVRGQKVSCFSRGQPLKGQDVLVFLRSEHCRDALAFYRRAGLGPVIVVDPARLPGSMDRWRIDEYLPAEPDFDRLDDLGIEIAEKQRVKAQPILILGQRTGYAGVSRSELQAWGEDVIGRLRALDRSHIVWRPSQQDVWTLPGADEMSDPRIEPLADALGRSWLAVTYSGSAGFDALLAGLPVVAEGPAWYAELTGDLRDLSRLKADPESLRVFLGRLAAAEMTAGELADGAVIEAALVRATTPPEPEAEPVSAAAPVLPSDDFTTIEGVGPAVQSKLEAAGIRTLDQLGDAGVDQLEQLLTPKQLRKILDWKRVDATDG